MYYSFPQEFKYNLNLFPNAATISKGKKWDSITFEKPH